MSDEGSSDIVARGDSEAVQQVKCQSVSHHQSSAFVGGGSRVNSARVRLFYINPFLLISRRIPQM